MTELPNAQQSRDVLDIIVAVAQMLGSLGTAGALWVTYRTLIELKRQTDLANNPILKLRFRFHNTLQHTACTVIKDYLDNEPFNCWLNIITGNLRQDISRLDDRYLSIELTNSGKSEITNVTLVLLLDVMMFENDVLGYKIEPTQFRWDLDPLVELGEKDSILIPIVNTRYFPIYNMRISELRFKDIRGNHFTIYDGESTVQKTNEILIPIRPTEEELYAHPEEDIPF